MPDRLVVRPASRPNEGYGPNRKQPIMTEAEKKSETFKDIVVSKCKLRYLGNR